MAKGNGGGKPAATKGNSDRPNQKGYKQRPKMFDAVKRRLVTVTK